VPAGGSTQQSRWQRLEAAINNCPDSEGRAIYLPRSAVHLSEDSREERALSTTDGSGNCGQVALVEMDMLTSCTKALGFLVFSSATGGGVASFLAIQKIRWRCG
jgi:hypothetical protein